MYNVIRRTTYYDIRGTRHETPAACTKWSHTLSIVPAVCIRFVQRNQEVFQKSPLEKRTRKAEQKIIRTRRKERTKKQEQEKPSTRNKNRKKHGTRKKQEQQKMFGKKRDPKMKKNVFGPHNNPCILHCTRNW